MKLSKLVAERTKETPNDAQTNNHKLMLRAGFMKQVANGIYTLTSLGQKACLNIENIIREEMNKCDGQEVKFPVVMPKELWDLSGRYTSIGSEMARFEDRSKHKMLLGMTHEEASVHLVKNWVTSYNQLPFMIYQIQTKFRDEPRSRGGLIRVREFTMKDAYSFHMCQEDLEDYYNKMLDAYTRIYKRIGLKDVIAVKGDSGMMGGNIAHEFMFLTPIGEDTLVICDKCGYNANQEVAECAYDSVCLEAEGELTEVYTEKAKEIKEVCEKLSVRHEKCVKAVVFAVRNNTNKAIVCFIRGDLEVNEAKLKKICKCDIVPYDTKLDENFVAGNIGPIGLPKNCDVYFDLSLKNLKNLVVGANKEEKHFTNFNIERDYGKVEFFDIAKVKEGQICTRCNEGRLKLSNGVEIGNIFQLGTKYTKSMNMLVKTKTGEEINPIMGCYGIGVGRNLACVIEQNCDEKGICLPFSIAPYKVHIVPLRLETEEVKNVAYELYNNLIKNNIETIIDDRDCAPGVKFADADLIGMPLRVVVSPRNLENGEVEFRFRQTGETVMVPIKEAVNKILSIINND